MKELTPNQTQVLDSLRKKDMTRSAWGEPRNFCIYALHPTLKWPPRIPFKGILPEVKQKCRELLVTLPEEGWVVKAVTDGQVLYAERKASHKQTFER